MRERRRVWGWGVALAVGGGLQALSADPSQPREPGDSDRPAVVNGTTWNDTAGNPITAHDGGISRFGDKFYWYGTSYAGNPTGKFGMMAGEAWNGVRCYSSSDLVRWHNEGVVLPRPAKGWCRLGTGARPKVIYNARTKKYVMWYCWALHSLGAGIGFMTVAIADQPTGPFQILGPRETGSPTGFGYDMSLFQDDDGKAYLIYNSEGYFTRIDRLSEDYQSSMKDGIIAMNPRHEAQTMIKHRGKYIVAGSGLGVGGWGPSETVYAVASSPMGPYSPLKTMSKEKTWQSQITCLFKVRESDTLVAMCDQWFIPDKTDLDKSRYLWIPVEFDPETGTAQMIYRDAWNPWKRGH